MLIDIQLYMHIYFCVTLFIVFFFIKINKTNKKLLWAPKSPILEVNEFIEYV